MKTILIYSLPKFFCSCEEGKKKSCSKATLFTLMGLEKKILAHGSWTMKLSPTPVTLAAYSECQDKPM